MMNREERIVAISVILIAIVLSVWAIGARL